MHKQQLILDFLPPSTNHSHGLTRNGIMYLKPETRKFREQVAIQCRLQKIQKMEGRISFSMIASYGAFKNGNQKRGDISNLIKQAQDALNSIAFNDDSQIDIVYMERVKEPNQKVIITMEEI